MPANPPRLRFMPEYADTLGPSAAEFMSEHGLDLDPWQRDILGDWLAYDAGGHWAATVCGLSVPRQNGKTTLLKARCYYGIAVLGEAILYTAHEVKTARETFLSMAGDFDRVNGWPDLATQTEYIRRANGQEEIKLYDWQDEETGEWHKGGRIVFSARTNTASLGRTFDVLVEDEAAELTESQVSALQPTISAGPLGNPQTVMIGTPPPPASTCEVFRRVRRQVLAGKSTAPTAWAEWSVAEVGDTTDWARVEATNPALDVRLMRTAVQAEMDIQAPDQFALMRLGWWPPDAGPAAVVIPSAKWEACETKSPPAAGLTVYAAKFSADGSRIAVAVCLKPRDGKTPAHVEIVTYAPTSDGIGGTADWLAQRAPKAAQIVVDGAGNAQALIDKLREYNVPKRVIQRPGALEAAGAYAAFVDAVLSRQVTHYGQRALTDSATKSTRRKIGARGGWGFESTEGADAVLVEAAALAYRSAITTKRDPERKAIIEWDPTETSPTPRMPWA